MLLISICPVRSGINRSEKGSVIKTDIFDRIMKDENTKLFF